MGNLSVQTLFSDELAKRRIFLHPPEPDAKTLLCDPGDGIYLGRTKSLSTPVFWDFKKLANPHIAVCGMSGSGKSYFIKAFITRAKASWGTSALILDWAGEYTPWVQSAGGKVVRLNEHGINIMAIDSTKKKNGIEAQKRVEQLISALTILADLGANPLRLRIMKAALAQAYANYGVVLGSESKSYGMKPASMPTLSDALKALRIMAKKSPKDPNIEACEAILESYCSKGSDYLSQKEGISLSSLVGGMVSVDLSGLNSDAHRSMAALTILQYLKERMRSEGWAARRELKLIVVADEAWKIAQDDSSDLVAILREGRKYAFGIIVSSQNPSDLSKTILSNAGTMIAFRLMLGEFREQLGKSLRCSTQAIDEMERYSLGEAMIRMAYDSPGLFDGPFVISKIDGEEPAKRLSIGGGRMQVSLSPEEFRKKLSSIGASQTQISLINAEFDKNSCELNALKIASMLKDGGFSSHKILALFRLLGFRDSDSAQVFSRLQAKEAGVMPSELAHIVIDEGQSLPKTYGKKSGEGFLQKANISQITSALKGENPASQEAVLEESFELKLSKNPSDWASNLSGLGFSQMNESSSSLELVLSQAPPAGMDAKPFIKLILTPEKSSISYSLHPWQNPQERRLEAKNLLFLTLSATKASEFGQMLSVMVATTNDALRLTEAKKM